MRNLYPGGLPHPHRANGAAAPPTSGAAGMNIAQPQRGETGVALNRRKHAEKFSSILNHALSAKVTNGDSVLLEFSPEAAAVQRGCPALRIVKRKAVVS